MAGHIERNVYRRCGVAAAAANDVCMPDALSPMHAIWLCFVKVLFDS